MSFNKGVLRFIPYICILFFSLIVINLGINDIEDYANGLFTSKIYSKNISNYLTFFYDFYGPGIRLPIGNGPLFHPLNIFLFNIKLYYFLFIFSHLLIQFIFTRRILNIFQIKYQNFILAIILVFSLPNLNYGLSDDWIAAFFSYCFFPIIFYYFLKIIYKQQTLAYFKISLLFSLWIFNGHIGILIIYVYFLLLYLIFSIQNFKHLKKIFNRYFFISFFLLFFILFEYGFFLITESNKFIDERYIQGSYSKRPFLEVFLPFEQFLSWTKINRLPGNPIIIYAGILISVYNIINFSKSIFRSKNKTDKIHIFWTGFRDKLSLKLSILFLIFILFSYTDFLKYTYLVSGIWVSRDIFLYLGIFIIFDLYKNIKPKLIQLINILIISYTFLFLTLNIHSMYTKKENNFVINEINESEFIQKLENLNLKKEDYKRLYLSPGLYPYILKGFENDGIFANTDLIKYNLSPFNGFFKNNSMHGFGDKEIKMSGWINPHFKYINNEFFLDLYKIEYLLISEKELKNLNNFKFKKIDTINTSKDISDREIKQLQNKGILINLSSNQKEVLLLFKRKFTNYSLDEKNFKFLKRNLMNCKSSKIDCILQNKELFQKSSHELIRFDNGFFKIQKYFDNDYLFLPFIYDKNWSSINGEFYNVNNFGMFFKKKNLKNKKNNFEIKYFDNMRKSLRIISLLSILILIYFIYIFSISKRNSNHLIK